MSCSGFCYHFSMQFHISVSFDSSILCQKKVRRSYLSKIIHPYQVRRRISLSNGDWWLDEEVV